MSTITATLERRTAPPPPRRRARLTALDYILLVLVAATIGYVGWRAGAVLHYRWDWSQIPQYILRWDQASARWVPNLLLEGLLATLRLAIWGTLLAAIIGTVMGFMRVARGLLPRMISRTYVELIRNIPPLVFIFVFYFFLANQIVPLLGVEDWIRHASPATLATIEILLGPPRYLPAVLSALICLALFEGAYITEIVRAGIQSIEKGQWEAATAMGLTRIQTMRKVILPQAIQRVVPPLAGQFISLVKDSSMVSLISIQELTFLGNEVAASTNRMFEVWITISFMYFAICYGLSLAFGRLERRMARSTR